MGSVWSELSFSDALDAPDIALKGGLVPSVTGEV